MRHGDKHDDEWKEINEDELVEITPLSIRLRKTILDETQRKRIKIAASKA